ncbi:DNA oxidative demethylase AlkB [Segnochrobactraceae bacterium EtOH-i3]
MDDLFAALASPGRIPIGPGAVILAGRARADSAALLAAIETVTTAAPLRHMVTPGGFRMSVAMTNCGAAGWVSDRRGYRYAPDDPETGRPWPEMPAAFRNLAIAAAREAGYPGFDPDACLVNCYTPGTRLSLHQDRNERDFGQPIVSVSLGLPATFQFGGAERTDPVVKHRLSHGDVVVWGGPSRLVFHGVLTLKAGDHPVVGIRRLNLTFRRAF